jgi:hypothetical protein
MMTPLELMLQGPSLQGSLYPPESRYHNIALAEITLADGRTVRYLRRRMLPAPEGMTAIFEYRVVEGDRLDNLANRFLGDPFASWRLADANVVLRMESLVEEVGGIVRIALAAGGPGASGA